MLGGEKLSWLWCTVPSLVLGTCTTLTTIALGTYFGPPPTNYSKANDAVFRAKEGISRSISQSHSRFVTHTHAALILAPVHLGQKQGTVVVQWYDRGFIDPDDLDEFLKVFDAEQQKNNVTQSNTDSRSDSGASAEQVPRYYGEEYPFLTSSPLLGASFSDLNNATIISEFAIGFPFRAAWTADYDEHTGGCEFTLLGPSQWISTKWKRPTKSWNTSGFEAEYGFPTGIIPFGFAANTTIYASAWFGLLSIPSFVRRRIAKRKNLCPNCRYDLHGIAIEAPCPECGTTK